MPGLPGVNHQRAINVLEIQDFGLHGKANISR